MVSEFQFIDNIRSKYSLTKIGDDCAVIPKDTETDLLLTADMLIEDIDFRLEWTTPEFLGHKSLAVSLSDIAAMGGEPKWGMLSIGVPEKLWASEFIERFYAGWFALAKNYGVEMIGGDISRSPDRLFIDSIAGGEVKKNKAIFRSTAKSGDAIFVSGSLGAAAGGLKLLENGSEFDANGSESSRNLILRQVKPQPKLKLANALSVSGKTTSLIDLSDGLSSDLAHICERSRVGAKIYSEKIPVDNDLYGRFQAGECLQMALNGGEDFELLFTIGETDIPLLDNLDVTQIGEITPNVGIIELGYDGKSRILRPEGYRHF